MAEERDEHPWSYRNCPACWCDRIANSAYTIASVSAGDAGVYTVVATNNAGSATSDTATLTINSAPNGAVTGVQVTQNGVTTPYNFSS